MKIAFLGNQDNNALKTAAWMREHDYEVDLYLVSSAPRDLPEKFRPEWTPGARSDWIRSTALEQVEASFARIRTYYAGHPDLKALDEAGYDIVVSFGVSGLYYGNHIRKTPRVHYNLGSDFTMRPFIFQRKNVRQLASDFLCWPLARRALKHARRLFTSMPVAMDAMDRLGHFDKLIAYGEGEVFGDVPGVGLDPTRVAELHDQYGSVDRVFLWLSRINYRDPAHIADKAADKFLHGLAAVAAVNPNVRAVVGEHGFDVAIYKALAAELNVDHLIDFVPHLPLWELRTYLAMPNSVIVDCLAPMTSSFGGLVRETIGQGALMIRYYDQAVIELVYGPHCPVMHAQSQEAVTAAMQELAALEPAVFAERRARMFEWGRQFMAFDVRVPILVAELEAAAAGATYTPHADTEVLRSTVLENYRNR